MDDTQMKSIAHMLARRSGVTDKATIDRDVHRWANLSATHMNVAAPTPMAVSQNTPGSNSLRHTVLRHQELVQTGIDAAYEGANLTEMQHAIGDRGRHLDEFSPVSFSPTRSRSSELGAFAQVQNTEYSIVHRFTDGLPSGNLTYRGKSEYGRMGRAPASFRPIGEERDFRPGTDMMRRAAMHFRGDTGGSPFVSVTAHVPSARRTTDHQLQAIMHGSPNRAGAPYIDTFSVPNHGLLRADTVQKALTKTMPGKTPGEQKANFQIRHGVGTSLAISEHEQLFAHETLDEYRTARGANPYRRQNTVGIYDNKSSFAANLGRAFSKK